MKFRRAAALLACIGLMCSGLVGIARAQTPAAAESPFALVMIDTESEKRLGGFPPDRKFVAAAIDKLAAAGARGVVLKFFYDHAAKLPASDEALAAAMARIPVALQAGVDDNEIQPNALPARFVPDRISGDYRRSISGKSGWIPIPLLSNVAADVGFADIDVNTTDRVPAIEIYQGRPVKSLTLVALEMAARERAQIISNERVLLGKRQIKLDENNQIRLGKIEARDPAYTSFSQLLDGKAGAARLRDKVVVIAYDGSKMHALTTSAGPIKAHRLFYLGLLDAWSQLAPVTSP